MTPPPPRARPLTDDERGALGELIALAEFYYTPRKGEPQTKILGIVCAERVAGILAGRIHARVAADEDIARFWRFWTPPRRARRSTPHTRRKEHTMPMYQGQPVSDEYLQGLIDAYRDGQKAEGGESAVEDSDQPIIDRLETAKIDTNAGAHALGVRDTKQA